MAATTITPEENSLLSTFPLCSECNNYLYQFDESVLLPCTHFLYCAPCYDKLMQREGIIGCQFCNARYEDLAVDPELGKIGIMIRELYTEESDPALRIQELLSLQVKIAAIFDRYRNSQDESSSPREVGIQEAEIPPLLDVANLPLEDVMGEEESDLGVCRGCGKVLEEGAFRCSCKHVDFRTYRKLHLSAELDLQVDRIKDLIRRAVEGDKEKPVEIIEALSIPEDQEIEPNPKDEEPSAPEVPSSSAAEPIAAVFSHQENPIQGPQTSTNAYQSLVEDQEPSSGEKDFGIRISETPILDIVQQQSSKHGLEAIEEEEVSSIPWMKIAMVILLIVLAFDLYALNN